MARRAPGGRGTFIQQSRAVSPEQKALYHHALGAGKSRVKREFFDVSDAELSAIIGQVEAFVGRRLASITAAGG